MQKRSITAGLTVLVSARLSEPMATTTRTRGMPGRTAARNARGRTTLSSRIAGFYRSARTSLPEIAGTPRFRRELLGVLLVLMALLSAYVIGRGGDEGRLVAWWGISLDRALGRAAFLVPVLIALAALRAFGGQSGRVLEGRHYLGGFAFAVAVVGLLQLGGRTVGEPAGGALGRSVASLALRILGPFGAGLALFAAGVLAIFLLAGSDFQTFCNDVRALLEATWGAISALIVAAAAIEKKIRRFGASLRSPVNGEAGTDTAAVAVIAPDPAEQIRLSRVRASPQPLQATEESRSPVINVPPRTPLSTLASPSSTPRAPSGAGRAPPDRCRFLISRGWLSTTTWPLTRRICMPKRG